MSTHNTDREEDQQRRRSFFFGSDRPSFFSAMASLPLYSYASFPLILLSFWHAVCSSRSYLRSPSLFHARSWHPFSLLRHGELYTEIFFFVSASIYHAIAISSLPPGSISQIHAYQYLFFLSFFTFCLFLTLISESSFSLPLPQEANFFFLAMAFALESFVLYRSASDPQLLLERESFHILSTFAFFSSVTSFLLSWRPHSFLVSMSFSASIFLQGTWLLQLGFSLFSERFLPQGCHRLSSGITQCDIEAAKDRAVAIMDLLFLVHVGFAVFVFVVLFGFVSKSSGYRRNGGYEGMELTSGNGESDHLLQLKPSTTKVVID